MLSLRNLFHTERQWCLGTSLHVYKAALAWMRCKLSFALLRSSIQCIRGTRSTSGKVPSQPTLWWQNRTFHYDPLSSILLFLLTCIHFLAFYITHNIQKKRKKQPCATNVLLNLITKKKAIAWSQLQQRQWQRPYRRQKRKTTETEARSKPATV